MTQSKEQEEAIFDAARMLASESARRVFLDEACGSDELLRERVEALLSSEGDAEKLFSEAAPKIGNFSKSDSASEMGNGAKPNGMEDSGSRIGRYKLLQKIGEGGCGVVYMAEQQEPVRRRVALKIIKLGMDTRRVIARFEAERQALAMMDHPNIARVLDGGATETGRPYFVMELVRGLKITEYCDQNNLDTRRRLDLFIQVCQAIQHAHQKGIIHRDIKPSNILVTLHDGVPVPKVIDFGIAKATEARLTDKTLFTAFEQFIGTPAYMSPEQAEMSGLDVDTRSDIYSLGVLLYESLTGKTPFDATKLLQSGVDEMRKTLREREPQRPSTMVTTLQGEELLRTAKQRQAEPPKLISLLRGDLDWIVMKALEKDRSRRYETANGLAMDIQRYLRNEPVVARPPSRIYRFQKFVRRNKAACAATAAVAAALLIGFGASTRLFFIEREAKKLAVIAEQRAEKARATEFQLRQEAEARERIVKAAVLIGENHLADADKLMDGMPSTPSTLEGASVYRSLAEWHALRKDWQKAVERYAVLLKVNQFDGWDITTLDYLGYGPALIESNDLPGYERFRKNVIARFAGTANPVVAERVVKICLLLPPDQRFIAGLSPFVDVALKLFDESASEADADVFRLAWASVSLSLMEFRKGNYQQALEWGRRCLDFPEKNEVRSATAHLIRAMALFRLGETESARSELAQGRAVVNAKFAQPLDEGSREEGFWFDWMFAKIILREASGMIGPGAM